MVPTAGISISSQERGVICPKLSSSRLRDKFIVSAEHLSTLFEVRFGDELFRYFDISLNLKLSGIQKMLIHKNGHLVAYASNLAYTFW